MPTIANAECRRHAGSQGLSFPFSRLRRILTLPLAAVLLLGMAACGGESGAVPTNAIAVVGGETVAKADLERLLDQARENSRQSRRPFPKPGTKQYLQIREQLIQFLVRRAQIADAAEERGIDFSAEEVEQRRNELVQQYFGGSEDLYVKQLEKNGVTEEQARADLEAALIQQALLADVGKDVKVSEAEMRRYYARSKGKYERPYGQDKGAVREDLLQWKKDKASMKYLERLARNDGVEYQVGFAPQA